MFDLSKLSTQYHVRPMKDADADALLAFCLQNDQLGIDKENPQSNAFWAKNGFSVIREIKQDAGAILLAEKRL